MTMAGKRRSPKLTPGQINLEALIENRGQITIGYLKPFECVAIANDERQYGRLAGAQARRVHPGVLERMDMAIEAAYERDEIIDEVNAQR
jgi:hypothetical protein